ncbi:hypothetical protein D3C71_1587520 [compost metagenome]
MLGVFGLLMVVMSPIVVFVLREWSGVAAPGSSVYFRVAAFLGVLCFCFVLLFHPLSSEMSEWGYWAVMLSWLSRLSNMKPEVIDDGFHELESQRV